MLADGVELVLLALLMRVSKIPNEGNAESLTGSLHDYLFDLNWEECCDWNQTELEWF